MALKTDMIVFLLEADSDKYQTLFPEREEDFDIVEKLNGAPIGDQWIPIKVEILTEYREDAQLPASDFPSMTTSALPVFSQRAVDALGEVLLSNGELLPLEFSGRDYFVFNVTTMVDALDIKKCDATYFPTGRVMTIRQYEFYPEKLKDLDIFKVPQFPEALIFVTDNFVKKVETARLKGFRFKPIWSAKTELQ